MVREAESGKCGLFGEAPWFIQRQLVRNPSPPYKPSAPERERACESKNNQNLRFCKL